MDCKCEEIVNIIENELNLINELIELVNEESNLHLVLDSKRDVYSKMKSLFFEKKSDNKKLMAIFKN